MELITRSEEQFVDLKDYPFEPHYVDVAAGDDIADEMALGLNQMLPETPAPTRLIKGTGHFIQDDAAAELSRVAVAFFEENIL